MKPGTKDSVHNYTHGLSRKRKEEMQRIFNKPTRQAIQN
jgi:hypothetical protein